MAKVSFGLTKRFLIFSSFGPLIWMISSQVGLLYLILLSGATLFQWVRFPRASQVIVKRIFPSHFVLSKEQTITIALQNKSSKQLSGMICDNWPKTFTPPTHRTPFELPPRGDIKIARKVVPQDRGEFIMESISLHATGYFVQKNYRFSSAEKLKVYPPYSLRKEIGALKFGEESKVLRMGFAGASDNGQFDSLRSYLPGEDLRHIDWKATARYGELISRNWTENRQRHIFLLIDGGRRMAESLGQYSRFDYALQTAIQLCHVAVEQGDSLSLITFSDCIDAVLPETEKQDLLPQVLETIYKLKPKTVESDYRQVFGQAMLQMKKRSLLILFSDLLDSNDSIEMLSNLSKAAKEHLILFIVPVNKQILQTAEAASSSGSKGYERQKILQHIKSMGVHVLETDAHYFNLKVIESYLNLRRRD